MKLNFKPSALVSLVAIGLISIPSLSVFSTVETELPQATAEIESPFSAEVGHNHHNHRHHRSR